ncbi:MAG: hypothetical protein ACK5ME_10450 [Parahaliea sp.]
MKKLSLLVSLLFCSNLVFAQCNAPTQPELPNGVKATMDDMLTGQKAVKAFQSANVGYMKCLEEVFTSAEAQLKKGGLDKDTEAKAQASYQEAVDAYNAAVSTEEAIAGRFNTEVREYKAANPK